MKYTIRIENEENEIAAVEVDADQAIACLAALLESADETEGIEEQEVEKPSKTVHVRKKETGKRVPRHCGNCGESGHDTRKCPRLSSEVVEVSVQREPLSEDAFNTIRGMKEEGLTSGQVIHDLQLNGREVNSAWGADSYEHYLEVRKTLTKI